MSTVLLLRSIDETMHTRFRTFERNLATILVAKRRLIVISLISFAVFCALVWYFKHGSNDFSYSKIVTDIIKKLGINETLYFNRFLNMGVSLEGDSDCNLIQTTRCYSTDKSLVLSFWREGSRDKWIVKNFLKVFDQEHFTRVIMVHDNSSWSSYPNREHFIWIHVNAQKRFWYLKRFLTPITLKTYKYIWIVDDDIELLFDTLHYECVITKLNISLSAPGRVKGIASHQITRVNNNYTGQIGRWTDFVEIGPIVVGSSSAWECLWHFLSSYVGLGWGLDLIWCNLIANKCMPNATVEHVCAVLDIFQVNHLSEYIGSTVAGSQEVPAYNQYYNHYSSKQIIIGPLANDQTIYSTCNKGQYKPY